MTEKSKSQNSDDKIGKWPYLVGAGILICLILNAILPIVITKDWQKAGPLGDTFGVANALFSGFAFLLLIVAVWLQRRELKLQRTELKLARREWRTSAQAQVESSEALRVQNKLAMQAALLEGINRALPVLTDRIAVLTSPNKKHTEAEREMSAQLSDLRRELQEALITVTVDLKKKIDRIRATEEYEAIINPQYD